MLKINWRRWEPTRFMLHHGPPHTRTHTVLYSYIKGWWEEKKQRDWGNIIVLLTSLLVIKVNHHLNRFEQTNTHTHTHAQIHTHRCCYYVGVWLIESITDTWCHTHTHTQRKCIHFPEEWRVCLSEDDSSEYLRTISRHFPFSAPYISATPQTRRIYFIFSLLHIFDGFSHSVD